MSWYTISNVKDIPSPALLVYPERVRENIRRMVAMVDDVGRLRPHIKTHKMAEVLRMHLDAGIKKFKCATIAEAELAAATGAPDVMLAYQPVGPNVQRLIRLMKQFPGVKFSAVADDPGAVKALSAACASEGVNLEVLIDLDPGMHRSGIEAGPAAVELYRLISSAPGLTPSGLHAYDGHNREADPAVRKAAADAYMAPLRALREELVKAGLTVPRFVASGSPTYPIHAKSPDVECSPGTTVFWDAGYGNRFTDMDFLHAALVLTRVVSKPMGNRLCLDLGHKAIAAENPHPRVYFMGLEDAKAVTHSEEHLVLETPRAGEFAVGDVLYGIPHHVCPTVALHGFAVTVENGCATGRWRVAARERVITV